MKKIVTICLVLLTHFVLIAQSPQKFSYQAIVRDADNTLITSSMVGIRISILQGSENGNSVYTETQRPVSNSNGLVSLEIGEGMVTSGDFTKIDWENGPFFIKTEIDPSGGTAYSVSGTSQLLSVPYALYAASAGSTLSGTKPGQMQYWNGSEWVVLEPGANNQVLTMVNGIPTWNGTGEVMSTTGKIWMDRNLGAARVATSSTDQNSFGYLYQWGRSTDGHQIRTSPVTTTLSNSNIPTNGSFILSPNTPFDWRSPQNNNLWQSDAGENDPCPNGFRLPTESELNEERLSWSSNNAEGAYNSPLKLTLAGNRNRLDGSLNNVEVHGNYWSSTVNGTFARNLYITNSEASIINNNRANGLSVRCIKN